MAFYKKVQIKSKDKDGKVQFLWYPRSVLVGSPIGTDQLAKRLAQESTVAPADVKAVLKALSGVMGDYMALGRSVKLEGIGSFYFTANAQGNGAETEKKCSVNQINGVKVVFIPETTYRRQGGGRLAVRALTDVDIEWVDVATLTATDDDESGDNGGGTTPVTPDPSQGGESGGNSGGGGVGNMTITRAQSENHQIGDSVTSYSGGLTIQGTDMTGTWKAVNTSTSAEAAAASVTATEVQFSGLTAGSYNITFNGTNVLSLTVVNDD